MKFKFALTMTLLTVATSMTASAGAGVRGGEVVDINGKYFARDTVEQARCAWTDGAKMMAEVPAVSSLLKKIAAVDWYFALDLEQEMRSLSYCLTGPLRPLPDVSYSVPQVPSPFPSIFIGLRHNGSVLLDEAKFFSSKMSDDMRALMLVHETMHSYIPTNMDAGERRDAVFSMIDKLHQIQMDVNVSREDLHVTMRNTRVNFPLTVSKLDAYRKQIEFAVGDLVQKSNLLITTPNIDSLVRGNLSKIADQLAPWHQATAQSTRKSLLEEGLRGVLSYGNEADIQNVFAKKSRYITPAIYALAHLSDIPLAQRQILLSTTNYSALINQVLTRMNESDIVVCELRLCGNSALQEWAGASSVNDNTPVMALATADAKLGEGWSALGNAIVILANNRQWSAIDTMIINNSLTLPALTAQKARVDLSNISAPIPREAGYSAEALDSVQKRSISGLRAIFESELDEDTLQILNSKLDPILKALGK